MSWLGIPTDTFHPETYGPDYDERLVLWFFRPIAERLYLRRRRRWIADHPHAWQQWVKAANIGPD